MKYCLDNNSLRQFCAPPWSLDIRKWNRSLNCKYIFATFKYLRVINQMSYRPYEKPRLPQPFTYLKRERNECLSNSDDKELKNRKEAQYSPHSNVNPTNSGEARVVFTMSPLHKCVFYLVFEHKNSYICYISGHTRQAPIPFIWEIHVYHHHSIPWINLKHSQRGKWDHTIMFLFCYLACILIYICMCWTVSIWQT